MWWLFLCSLIEAILIADTATGVVQRHEIDLFFWCQDENCAACRQIFDCKVEECSLEKLADCLAGKFNNIGASTSSEMVYVTVTHKLYSDKVCQGRRGVVQRSAPFVGISQLGVSWTVEFETKHWIDLTWGSMSIEITFDPNIPGSCTSQSVVNGTLSLSTSETSTRSRSDHTMACGSGRRGDVAAFFDIRHPAGGTTNSVQVDDEDLRNLLHELRMLPQNFRFGVEVSMDHSCIEYVNRSLSELRLLDTKLEIKDSPLLIVVPGGDNPSGCCMLTKSNIDLAPLVAPAWISELVATGGRTCEVTKRQCTEGLQGEWDSYEEEDSTTTEASYTKSDVAV